MYGDITLKVSNVRDEHGKPLSVSPDEIGKAFAQRLFDALSSEFSCEVSVKEARTGSVDIGFTVWMEPNQDTLMRLIRNALGSDQEVHLQPGTSQIERRE
jgi:hypothetical protein